ncbi:MAG: 50S ribosome-binding GTPase [Cytophagaceae bacterium]|jgi:LAO/AO transport system kinase|nr:50S ribosome-binding GTPase [Cytophagaceae bacterium]
MIKPRLTVREYVEGISAGDTAMVSKVLTLLESKLESDRHIVRELFENLPSSSASSIRIGITGIPGAGKSSLVNAWIPLLAAESGKTAILTIDPSSPVGGGSIMGDKTRMHFLHQYPGVFVRPSSNMGYGGGTHQATLDALRVLEAAGFEHLLVETVGVGQTEVEVSALCDAVVLVWVGGTGDELQWIKRGITEVIDVVLLHKAERINEEERTTLCRQMALVLERPCWPSSAMDAELAESSWGQLRQHLLQLSLSDRLARRQAREFDFFKSILIKEFAWKLDHDSHWQQRMLDAYKQLPQASALNLASDFWNKKN